MCIRDSHPVTQKKDGQGFIVSPFKGEKRSKNNALSASAIVLDVDNGHPIEDAIKSLEQLGVLAAIYTSYSHGKTKSEVTQKDIEKLQGEHPDANDAEMAKLVAHLLVDR